MKLKLIDSKLVRTRHGAIKSKEGIESSRDINYFNRQFWVIWFVLIVVAFFIQLLTLDVLPQIQQDEAQITDYGRLALNPHSDWSVTWRVADGKPLLLWSYLGPLIAEFSWQIGGSSGIGPRIASLIGGVFAATMALGWLLMRKVPMYAALAISVAFLLDPLFVLSQRMARPDSWVIAFCLASCLLLRRSINNKKYVFKYPIIVSGGLAAGAAFIWPSAIFLFPLIALELFEVLKVERAINNKNKNTIGLLLSFAGGGLAVSMLLLIPVWQNIIIILNDTASMVTLNVDSSKTLLDRLFPFFNMQNWQKMVKAFVKTFSPIFPLLAFGGVIIYRQKGLLISLIASMAIIFASLVYEFRVMYLIPYFMALGSGIFIRSARSSSNLLLKNLSIVTLSLLLIWSVGISLFIRTAIGLRDKTERDRNKLYQVAASTIGPGDYNVFLAFTYEFYFVGRSLGWDLYTPYIIFSYDSQGNWIRENDYKPTKNFLQLLSKMDYAIFSNNSVTNDLEKQLNISGLYLSKTFQVGEENSNNKELLSFNRNKNMMMHFLQGKESYGSYVLYARDRTSKKGKEIM